MKIGGKEYRIFAEKDMEEARRYKGNVLIERHCQHCGDPLLGNIDITSASGRVTCPGPHSTRPGASYVGK